MKHTVKTRKKIKIDKVAISFIAPAFILYFLFIIWPTISSVYYSFTSWDGISPDMKFVGLANYKEIFTSARFGNALKNTCILTVFISVLENVMALALALIVDNVKWFKNLFRSAFYIPVLISGIVSGFIWKIMYNYNFGAINSMLTAIGLGDFKQDWLGNTALTLIMVGVVLVWKGAGYYMIIYLASLQSISTDMLLDISMPGMTGIEILKSIHQLGLPTKVIFISGFQDFEYAKGALTYGAVEYLLKLVIREELLKAVEKAVGSLLGEIDVDFKEKILQRDYPGMEYAESPKLKNNTYNTELEVTTYQPVLAEILFEGNESIQEQKLLQFSFRSFLEEYLEEKDCGILFTKEEHLIIVLKGLERKTAKELLHELWEESCQTTGKRTAFVLGNLVDSMRNIPEEYKKCLEYDKYFFFEDQIVEPVLVAGEPVFHKKVGMEEITVAREQVLDSILAQDQKAFDRAYDKFARVLCLLADGRKEDACYYFCSVMRLVEERMRSMNLDGNIPDVKELLEKGRSCHNFLEMKTVFRTYLEEYPVLMKNSMENNEKKDIVKAKEYIEKHYRENLTLEILAGEVYMNPYYFSSFFKKNAGENFKDYVNKVRIQHAVTLLVSTNMKTYEIAAEVGFRDVRSFTEVFSRLYGETPNSYRKRVLSGK